MSLCVISLAERCNKISYIRQRETETVFVVIDSSSLINSVLQTTVFRVSVNAGFGCKLYCIAWHYSTFSQSVNQNTYVVQINCEQVKRCSRCTMVNMCNSSMEQLVLWRPVLLVLVLLWSCLLELQLVNFIHQSIDGVTVDCSNHLTMPACGEVTRWYLNDCFLLS